MSAYKNNSYDALRMRRTRRRKRRRIDITNSCFLSFSSSDEDLDYEELEYSDTEDQCEVPKILLEPVNLDPENQTDPAGSPDQNQDDSNFEIDSESGKVYFSSSESESDPNDMDEFGLLSEPLYENSSISIVESAMLIMTYIMVTKIPWQHAMKLLVLIQAHLPLKNNAITSVHKLQKIFSDSYGADGETKKFCIKCNILITEKGNCKTCSSKDGFLIMPIDKQVSDLFHRTDIIDHLQSRFHKNKQNESNFEDISDGNMYNKFKEFLSNVFNFSMTWYTDGVQVFKSSKLSLWPFLLTINELPYKIRFLPQNVIFGGIWYGKDQPDFNLFLRPLYDSLYNLSQGITICNIPFNGSCVTKIIRGIVLCGTCDLPAKSKILNSINFNGFYGCLKCMIKGKKLKSTKVFTYPYLKNIKCRTSKEYIEHGLQADNSNQKSIFGAKGSTILSKIVPDCIKTTGCDIMHLLMAGTGRKLIHLWFSNKYKKFPLSMFKSVKDIDLRLISIQPPYFVQRYPRSIVNHLKFWKSSEVKNWLFYYSIPCLINIMTDKYFNHYLLLVQSCYMLCRESISNDDLIIVQKDLEQFVSDFASLYGSRFMTANVHQLLHLVECVRDLGPLYFMSCFPYEDLNGKLTRLVHGTSHPALQIISAITFIKKMPIVEKNLKLDSHMKRYVKALNVTKKVNAKEEIYPGVFVVGKLQKIKHDTVMISEALHDIGITSFHSDLFIFKRLKKEKLIYATKSYTGSKNNISYCIVYRNEFIGFIEFFIKAKLCNCLLECDCLYTFLAVVQKCQKIRTHETCRFVHELCPAKSYTCVKIFDLQEICFCSVIGNKIYVTRPVNNVEFE